MKILTTVTNLHCLKFYSYVLWEAQAIRALMIVELIITFITIRELSTLC